VFFNKATGGSLESNSKAARLADLSSSQTERQKSEPPPAAEQAASKVSESIGWDPYEIWRSRVLLPRLEDRTTAETEDKVRKQSETRR
jgi:hypothetical protein